MEEDRYTVEIFWSDKDDGYIAIVPDLPGCSAFGGTRDQAAEEIAEAIHTWRVAHGKAGNPIPMPTLHRTLVK